MHPLPLLLAFASAGILPDAPGLTYQQPQLASLEQRVGLTFGSAGVIYYSGSSNGGASFGKPVAAAKVPGLALGNHRGPRVALTSGAIVINAAVAPPGTPFAPGDLWSWRSADGGKTWSAGAKIFEKPGGGLGFHALASDGKRRVWSVWIGPSAGRVKLFGSLSDDEGLSWSKPAVIYQSPDGNVCECCHPTASIGPAGELRVMFRNSLAGARDLYLATSRSGGESFTVQKLGRGSWMLEACPMDGGGMAEWKGEVSTLWRRNGDLFLAKPGGSEEMPVGPGKNAAIAAGPKGLFQVWSSPNGLMWLTPSSKAPRVLSKAGVFAALTGHGPVVAAWEEDGQIRIEKLD